MSVKVMRIATGEEEEEIDQARSAAAELGSRGGKARAASLSAKRRREIAKNAAAKRWKT
ncbi:MAG TPA: RNA-binding protein [Pseudolabrys sp.]|nr:RNA-binding protein [Pseudolabrys sp.]